MLSQDIKRKIDNARAALVGKVPDPKGQIDQITNALIYKFMDDADREAKTIDDGKARFFTDDLERFAWHNFFLPQLNNQQKADRYFEGVERIAQAKHLPPLFRDIFKGAFVPFRDADTTVLFLNQINEFSPYHDNSEELGSAFEYLLHFMGTQGDAGQFRTPPHIIDFIVDITAPTKTDKILDPACGTAGFLVSAYKYIAKHNELTSPEKKKLAKQIEGVDIDPQMAKIARVNLYLHGFNTPKIQEGDTLTNKELWKKEKYHVILANPPFMTPMGGIQPHDKFSIKANRSEVLFVDYIAEHLWAKKGRAGIIVPEGIIFQAANAYKALRKNLIEDWGLFAVVSLPSGVFSPYSGVKTSVLLLDKDFSCGDILFIKAENDGYDLGAQRRPIDKNDLPAAVDAIKQWKKARRIPSKYKTLAHNVSKEKIAEDGDYNLTGGRYRETMDYRNAKWPMVELGELEEKKNIEISRGQSITKKQVTEGDIPVIAGGQSPAYFHNSANRVGSVITISGSGAYAGFVNFFVKPIFASDCTTIQSTSKDINISFIYHFLKNQQNKIYSLSSGMAQPHIYPKNIRTIKIPLPPLEIQEEIAAEIDAYQKVIDGAKQVIANWKPHIPVNSDWDSVPLGEILRRENNTINPNGKKGNIKYIGLENIQEHTGEIVGNVMNNYENIKSAKNTFKNGKILYGKLRPNLNKVAFTTHSGICSTDILVLDGDAKKINNQFFSIYLRNKKFNDEVLTMVGGAQLPRVSWQSLSKIKIPLPPLKVQEKLAAEIEAEQEVITANKILIAKMEQKITTKIAEVWGE